MPNDKILADLPLTNRIQEARNIFVSQDLENDEDPDLGKIAKLVDVPYKTLERVAVRSNWWASRRVAKENWYLARDNAISTAIENAAVDVQTKVQEYVGKTVTFIDTTLPKLLEILETRATTMSDKDLLTYLKIVLDEKEKFIKTVKEVLDDLNKSKDPDGQDHRADTKLVMELGLKAQMIDALKNRPNVAKKTADAIIKEAEVLDERAKAFLEIDTNVN
jgi:hypothetical protein